MRLNVPNVLTSARIVITPFVYYAGIARERELFLLLFALGGLTDALDGFFARFLQLKSDMGSLFDTIADLLFYPTGLMIYFFAPAVITENWKLLAGVIGIFLAGVFVAWLRGNLYLPHLLSAKMVGIFMYVFILYTLLVEFSQPLFYVMVAVGAWAAIEQFVVGWRGK